MQLITRAAAHGSGLRLAVINRRSPDVARAAGRGTDLCQTLAPLKGTGIKSVLVSAARPLLGPATRPLRLATYRARGHRFARRAHPPAPPAFPSRAESPNPLEAYFDAHTKGPGIWKWRHYFDIYHRHFSRFVGQEVHVVEIGVYSGGSLGMWRDYFGPRSQIYGVDIEEECRAYAGDGVQIFIGDQSSPTFWERFRREVPDIDVVIDDGGHQPDQQIATLEGLLPYMRAGGVFLCEDVASVPNGFDVYTSALMAELNDLTSREPTALQQMVGSVHRYPFVTVIEKPPAPLPAFSDPKRGTRWLLWGRDGPYD